MFGGRFRLVVPVAAVGRGSSGAEMLGLAMGQRGGSAVDHQALCWV